MTTLLVWQISGILAVAILVLVFLFKRLAKQDSKLGRHPYQKQPALFSADERALFIALKQAVGADYVLFGKIRVEDIIQPKKGASDDAFDAIEGRHFDIVLCDPASLVPICALVLRDGEEDEPDPLPSICENVGLPLLMMSSYADYSLEALQDKVRKVMVKEPLYWVETDGRKEPRISNIDNMKF